MQLTQALLNTMALASMVIAAPAPQRQMDKSAPGWVPWGNSNPWNETPEMCYKYEKKPYHNMTSEDLVHRAYSSDCKNLRSMLSTKENYNLYFSSLDEVNTAGRAKGFYTVATEGTCSVALRPLKAWGDHDEGITGNPMQAKIGYRDITKFMDTAIHFFSAPAPDLPGNPELMCAEGWEECSSERGTNMYGHHWIIYNKANDPEEKGARNVTGYGPV